MDMSTTAKITKAQAAVLYQIADGTRVLMCGRVSGNVYVTSRIAGDADYERVNSRTFYTLLAYRPAIIRETNILNDRFNKWFEITDEGRAALAAFRAKQK